MRINFIGAGKLGLAYAAYISSKGHTVHCVDNNETLVENYTKGNFMTSEPDVVDVISSHPMTYGTLPVDADLTIILVNTPTCYAGYDHSILESLLKIYTKNVIITSTVQPGFCDRYPGVTYNPLFVQIGNIMANLRSTTDVLVGGVDGAFSDFFASLYDGVTLHYMSHLEAEVAKLALNSFITTKISFANMIGDALRRAGKPSTNVLKFVGSDSRIGNRCFAYGWGYGGPCFPRDNRALCTYLRQIGTYDYLPVAAHESNERHAVEQSLFEEPVFDNMCYKDDCDVPVTEESHKVKTALIMKSAGKDVKINYPHETLPQELHSACLSYRPCQ
jgi:nucleotide sugar dehydrogenase